MSRVENRAPAPPSFFHLMLCRNLLLLERRSTFPDGLETDSGIPCNDSIFGKRSTIERTDELYAQKKEELSTMNQLLSQIQTLQDQVNALNEAKEFYDPETASSSGKSHVSSQHPRIPSPRGMLSRDSGLPHCTRNSMGALGTICEQTLAPAYCEGVAGTAMRHGEGLRREPQSSTIPTPRFSRNLGAWNSTRRTGGTYSQNCMMDAPRYTISELHLGKFPDPDDFQCWRVSFKTEVCVSKSTPEPTVSWINEVEMAGFIIDDLLTSQSNKGESLPDFEMFDARIASACRKFISSISSRKSVEEQRAQKYNRFLRGRQIAKMLFVYFQSTGAHDAAQGLSDLFSICLQDDDVQDFDTRWDHILLGTSEM